MQLLPELRAFLAKSFFKLSSNKELILRLQSDSSLRRICGFTKVPSGASFSRLFDELSRSHIMEQTLNRIAEEYYEEQIVGHISRDSTAITAVVTGANVHDSQLAIPMKEDGLL